MKNSPEMPRKGVLLVPFFKQILQNSYKVIFGNVRRQGNWKFRNSENM
jgi:hypothetical protein